MMYRFLFPIVNWLMRGVADVTVTGVENMPYGVGVLLVSNHLTNFDPLVIGMCFKRELYFMAKFELYRNRLVAWFITRLRAFPVRRGQTLVADSVRGMYQVQEQVQSVAHLIEGLGRRSQEIGRIIAAARRRLGLTHQQAMLKENGCLLRHPSILSRIEGGRIFEYGPPGSLFDEGGHYASLHRSWLESLA